MSPEHITQPPTQELIGNDETLNTTVLVSPLVYKEQYDALSGVQREVVVESAFGYDVKSWLCGQNVSTVS